VMHQNKASVQPVITASAVRTSTATSVCECPEELTLPLPEASVLWVIRRFSADRWSNGYKTWWPIYTPHPGHLKFAGVAGHPTHTQEHLQAIQKHQDHILSP